MYILIIYFSILYISVVDSNETLCSDKYYVGSKKIDVDLCSETPCITKCCPLDRVIGLNLKCMPKSKFAKKNEFNESLYKMHSWNRWSRTLTVTSKKFSDFNIIHNERFSNDDPHCYITIDHDTTNIQYFLMEDGSVKIRYPNHYMRYDTIKPLEFCIDLTIHPKTHMIGVLYRQNITISIENNTEFTITAAAMLVSSFFLVVVLLVYVLLPELQNLNGMMFMALVASLAAAYFTKACTLLIDIINSAHATEKCTAISAFYYFTLLSSFFWMNVMSYDVWWTCRGYRKCRKIHRRGIMNKFCWYCFYAHGVPLLMTIGAVMVDLMEVGPDVVKPYFKYCLNSRDETFLYLSIPMAILLVMNCVLFLMTAYNIWLTKKRVNANPDSRNTKQHENRYMVYLKLSLIMGINFIIEMMDFIFTMPMWSVVLVNVYNLFIGVAIFFLFVFKKSILVKLCVRFNIKNRFVENAQSSLYANSENSKNITTITNSSQRNHSGPGSALELGNFSKTS